MHLAILALLFTACTSCSVFRPTGQSSIDQYNAMVMIRTTCSDGRVGHGSGTLVSEDRVLTAAHVVNCEILPGIPLYQAPNKIEVLATSTMKVDAVVELDVVLHDVARLKLRDKSLASFFTPVRVGPPPTLGERVCEAAAVPRTTYRCGEAQEARPGRIVVSMMIENGNSGSGMFDSRGRLVGIVTNLIRCQDGVICAGYGTALAGHAWLVPE